MQRLFASALLLILGLSSVSAAAPDQASVVQDQPPLPQPAPITVSGASEAQRSRLEAAIARFSSAELTMPALAVTFHGTKRPCRDHLGLFVASTEPWEVHLCAESVEAISSHELAHAWVAHNVTDQQRQAFMDLTGLETWNDQGYPWNERGIELAAVVIQQGISGLPLPPALSEKTTTLHVEGYQLLAGAPSPRYLAWLDTYGESARSQGIHGSTG